MEVLEPKSDSLNSKNIYKSKSVNFSNSSSNQKSSFSKKNNNHNLSSLDLVNKESYNIDLKNSNMNKNETDIKSLGNIAKVMKENNNINKSMRNKIEELIEEIKIQMIFIKNYSRKWMKMVKKQNH